jgi:hypothetical protein
LTELLAVEPLVNDVLFSGKENDSRFLRDAEERENLISRPFACFKSVSKKIRCRNVYVFTLTFQNFDGFVTVAIHQVRDFGNLDALFRQGHQFVSGNF